MELSPVVNALLDAFGHQERNVKNSAKFSVSRTVSVFAVLYEKARNAVEFRAEHLVRRAAIQRILKRRMMLESDPKNIAENLVVELLWAKYIDSSMVSDNDLHAIAAAISKYQQVKIFGTNSTMSWDIILGIASAEIDEIIVSPTQRQALINFVYQAIRPQIQTPSIDESHLNMFTYIAVEKMYAQSDDSLIICHLLRVINPQWFTETADSNTTEIQSFFKETTAILQSTKNLMVQTIGKYLKKRLPPFLLLRDLMISKGDEAKTLLTDPKKLEETLTAITNEKYLAIGAKVRRAVVRSIIYIFLTKMVFALALEAPFDLFIAKQISYIPLFINLLFPPLLLFLIAGFITIPGAENTKQLTNQLSGILYQFNSYQKSIDPGAWNIRNRRPILTAVFSVFYLIAFLLSFGAITFVLTKLHFNIASQIIFVFFVALVSIFAYRIRQSAKEYEVVERQGIMEPLMDFFFLPILYAGDFLSREIAKINIFIFFFDFILEAPLKVIFEVIEEWIRFIRIKKEEII